MTEVNVTKLSSKGQVIIPKNLREMLNLKEGEVFAVYGDKETDTIILKRLKVPPKEEFNRLFKLGEDFAKKRGITSEDVIKAIKEIRER